jgi:hypothetical protein
VNCVAPCPHKIEVLRAALLGHGWPVTSGQVSLWLGRANLTTTEIYPRGAPQEVARCDRHYRSATPPKRRLPAADKLMGLFRRFVMGSEAGGIFRQLRQSDCQLTIMEFANKAGNGRRPLPVVTGVAPNAREPLRGNGSLRARPSYGRYHTSTSCFAAGANRRHRLPEQGRDLY